ncbi:SDR family oxidoreductase [Oscillatoria sp. FACHB-1407]|uniref:SDR family oxidoreductase n=1 Tax=Oscillatoria sp. FACHB-1407 TaxID=2692847 RepID=UPI001689D587|nr:SDR family oxidoreductase [Oscillatoria sp. FACHB-1407]MBD2465691.1 SDR family oxidoreductase [Oscillatoria sp. FACHB-1407]
MNKIALVTGASRGLGRAIALRLAKDGMTVVIHYSQNQTAADEVVSEIKSLGSKAFAVQADISKTSSIASMFEEIDVQLETITGECKFDVLVNNAGTAIAKPVNDWTEEDFDYQFALNVKGLFFVTQFAIPRLRNNSRIINLGTGLTRFSYPIYAVYAASKGAVDVLSQHLAVLLGEREITVNTIAPGAIDTDLNASWLRSEEGQQQTLATSAIKRIGMPDDIADVVSFLASEDSRWVTGQRIEASGGAHL